MAKTKSNLDWVLIILAGLLLVIGLAMLWSASTAEAEQTFGSTSYFLIRQLTRGVLIGLVGMYILSRFDYHHFKKLSLAGMVIALVLLVMVKIPGLGLTANGATRWIAFGPLLFQPGEFIKLAMIIYLASWHSSVGKHITSQNFWKSVFPPLVLIGLAALLIIWQPDLGTTIALTSTSLVMFFIGGVRLRYIAGILAAGVVSVIGIIILEPYRLQRITAYLNPSGDPLGISYQINQALIAIGSGGLFGYGYGLSRQKHFYLPEAINDSIFAVMAEELGFVRVVIVLIIFALFIIRAIQISMNAPDNFGKILGSGISALFAISVIINVGAITGLIPLTGIPLPLFSYGSSSMIINLAAIGILLNISRQSRTKNQT
jgi:cell division protein FtsW